MIERTFQNIPEGKVSEADQQSFFEQVSLGWSRGSDRHNDPADPIRRTACASSAAHSSSASSFSSA